jgi:hypothetical protein
LVLSYSPLSKPPAAFNGVQTVARTNYTAVTQFCQILIWGSMKGLQNSYLRDIKMPMNIKLRKTATKTITSTCIEVALEAHPSPPDVPDVLGCNDPPRQANRTGGGLKAPQATRPRLRSPGMKNRKV